MDRVRVDRSNPGRVDVVLREGIGPFGVAVRRWPGEVTSGALVTALLGFPVYVVMAFYDFGPGAIWAAIGGMALVGGLFFAGTTLFAAYRDVHRLRFTPAAAPDTLTFVRSTRADPPRRLAQLDRVWIEDYRVDSSLNPRKPVAVKLTLFILTTDGCLLRRAVLPPSSANSQALQRELDRILTPAGITVEMVVKHSTAAP
ncbi:hypothetical protein AB0442_38840 [Kitasatospora sp. NPDC085895]|uniref:hypothetical protein n=1 Tax=Kitasatospora sp. NPDC085895 TaxID=3155057 RepID=UPI00344F9160